MKHNYWLDEEQVDELDLDEIEEITALDETTKFKIGRVANI